MSLAFPIVGWRPERSLRAPCRGGVGKVQGFDLCTHPDGNDLELMRDRQPEQWPRNANGQIAYVDRELDLDQLLADAPDR
jgi:hypothetical protein